MFLLHRARGDVVDDGVPKYVIERVFARHVLGVLADHHAELALVVHRAGRVQRERNFGRDRRARRRLGENHRIGRHVLLVAGLIDAALGEFAGVVVVVLADADDVLDERPDRRGELGFGKPDRLAVVRGRSQRR